jgi:hypothetical protein
MATEVLLVKAYGLRNKRKSGEQQYVRLYRSKPENSCNVASGGRRLKGIQDPVEVILPRSSATAL